MPKRKLGLIILLATLISLFSALVIFSPSAQAGQTVTHELLGPSEAYFVRFKGGLVGFTRNDYAGFLIYGREAGRFIECRLVHIWGGEIDDAEKPIPCRMLWRNVRFQGWINFRGHERSFCGVIGSETLPVHCRLKGE